MNRRQAGEEEQLTSKTTKEELSRKGKEKKETESLERNEVLGYFIHVPYSDFTLLFIDRMEACN